MVLTDHAHGHSTVVISVYVKSFHRDEVVMKSRMPDMNSTNRMTNARNTGLNDCGCKL